MRDVTVDGLTNSSFIFAFDSTVTIDGCQFSNMSAMVGAVIFFSRFDNNEIAFEPQLAVRGSSFENLEA